MKTLKDYIAKGQADLDAGLGIYESTAMAICSRIPGDHDWWRREGCGVYAQALIDLCSHGYTVARAYEVLKGLYGACRREYGD